MFRSLKMLCGVFVFRRVAAADVATAQAQPQMHPTVAHLQAFFAALGLWFNGFNLIEVRTVIGHNSSPEELYGGLNRNAHLESRVAGNRRYADLAVDIFDDAVNDVKAKPRAFADALGSEKGIEDA